MDPAVKVESLTKRYSRRTIALSEVSLVVKRGSVVGLIGPNGAGKTTLLNILAGFLKPTTGKVSVLGHHPSELWKASGKVSILPQDTNFPPGRRVFEVLEHLARLQGMDKGPARSEVTRVLSTVGLLDRSKANFKELSHGMAKRIGIAQAFLGNPGLILLDEPTAGLDPVSASGVRKAIQELSTPAHTILISSHNLYEIEDLCDHLAVLDSGKLVFFGPIDEFVERNHVIYISTANDVEEVIKLLANHPGIKSISEADTKIKVVFESPNRPVEKTISEILLFLIQHGVMISEVTRGERLQEKFLQVT